ncbi:MAG TPA: dihydrodipicolinate synthase family protein [Gaiellaceae bacterium]|jgi:dihydrodipicolinate synthase/N-acetylneuraminate lyase
MTVLRGAVAAAVTPLRDGGARLDEDAFAAYADFLHAGGIDGLLALGTTGEGILLSVDERSRAVELFVQAAAGRFFVIAHCGAQTTADTVELVQRASGAGVDAVAVIGPPYFKLDAGAQLAHLEAAAAAAGALPFYVYEFAATAGYPFALEMLARLRDRAGNFKGLKVSDMPWEAFEPYLLDGLDVFVGPEALIHLGLEHGAVGCVSGLAAAFPEEVTAVARAPSASGAEHVGGLRAVIERFPRHAALKRVLERRGVPVRTDVRAPLRPLTPEEAAELDAWLEGRGG